MDEKQTLMIEIGNLTEPQAIAVEDLLRTWVRLSVIGSSRWTCFYADGDGNFHPDIKVNGCDPITKHRINPKKLWHTIGIKEYKGESIREAYMIDFDHIVGAKKASDEQKTS